MMNKKALGITAAGLISGITIALGIFFLVSSINRNETIRPDVEGDLISLSPTPVLPSASKRTYENESGFLFKHPADISIEEREVDASTYADLELVSSRASGTFTFVVRDSIYEDISEWVDSRKEVPLQKSVTDITMGGVDGKQIVYESAIHAAILDHGALFVAEVASEDHLSYWQQVYEMLVDTFEFVAPEQAPAAPVSSGSSGGGDIIFEGEEILE